MISQGATTPLRNHAGRRPHSLSADAQTPGRVVDKGCLSPGSPNPTPHPPVPLDQVLERRMAGAGKYCRRWHSPTRRPPPHACLTPGAPARSPRSTGERPPLNASRPSSISRPGCAPRRCFLGPLRTPFPGLGCSVLQRTHHSPPWRCFLAQEDPWRKGDPATPRSPVPPAKFLAL